MSTAIRWFSIWLTILINVVDLCTSTMMGRIPASIILGPRYSNRLPGKIKRETETEVVAFDPSSVVVTQQWHWENFFRCAIAGAFSCASVHSLLLPFQALEATKGQAIRMASRNVRRMVTEGFGATFTGYFVQGAAKFGFYDLFKGNIIQMAFGEQNTKLPDSIRIPILMLSSAAAEVIACWALSPMEVARMQMMMVATSPGRHKGMVGTLVAMVRNEGFRSLFKGLPLLLVRQVPYTVIKLAGYEIVKEQLIRRNVDKDGKPLEVGVGIHLTAGVMAGILAAIVSQPADIILKRTCGQSLGLSDCLIVDGPWGILDLIKEQGWRASFKGVKRRGAMTGIFTALQFQVYEMLKKGLDHIDNNNLAIDLSANHDPSLEPFFRTQ